MNYNVFGQKVSILLANLVQFWKCDDNGLTFFMKEITPASIQARVISFRTEEAYRLLPVWLGYTAIGIAGDDDASGRIDVIDATALQVIVLDCACWIGLNVGQSSKNGDERCVIDILHVQVTRLVDTNTISIAGITEDAPCKTIGVLGNFSLTFAKMSNLNLASPLNL